MTWNRVVHSIEGSLGCPLHGVQAILCEGKAVGVARRPLYLFKQARSASLGTWPTFGPKLSSHTSKTYVCNS